MNVKIKRVYEDAAAADGFRVLVDRVWPRGITKEDAHLGEWLKDVAPSTELRKWYAHDPEKFDEFAERYRLELAKNTAVETLRGFIAENACVTIVFGAHDPDTSQAAVLRDYLGT